VEVNVVVGKSVGVREAVGLTVFVGDRVTVGSEVPGSIGDIVSAEQAESSDPIRRKTTQRRTPFTD